VALSRRQLLGCGLAGWAGAAAGWNPVRGAQPANVAFADSADFDEWMGGQLRAWHVPGLAVAIVVDGHIALLRAYGLRDVERNLPMTVQTPQPIASVSKIFTAAALALRVHEGQLEWDRPFREYMPGFRLKSDYATQTVSLRDMLSHRTGLGRHDFSWFNAGASRDELIARIRHLDMASEPRTQWQYNNWMVLAASTVAAPAGGEWASAVQRRLLAPLRMHGASTALPASSPDATWATGYRLDGQRQAQPVPFMNLPAMGPFGGINADAEEMARFLRMLVNDGTLEGAQVLPGDALRTMCTPQMLVPTPTRFAEIGQTQYGLGLFLTQYRGERLAWHGGNLPGVTTLLSFIPARRLGIYVACNQTSSVLPTVLTYTLYDRLGSEAGLDWSERFSALAAQSAATASAANDKNLLSRKMGTHPTHDNAALAGDYEHPGYGRFSIAADAAHLRGSFNGMSSTFKHFHYNVFEAPQDRTNDFTGLKLQFHLDLDGNVSHFTAKLDASTAPITFMRAARDVASVEQRAEQGPRTSRSRC
jgi:CubicO group peptidase (beta-lactamase class C family)